MTDLSREGLTKKQKATIMLAQQAVLGAFQVFVGGFMLMILAGIAHHDIITAIQPFGYGTAILVVSLGIGILTLGRYSVDTRDLFD